jgi:hypothetical protein
VLILDMFSGAPHRSLATMENTVSLTSDGVIEGTLEVKISAIIERKRRLMESVVQADDPRLSKIFSREELIDLLEPV